MKRIIILTIINLFLIGFTKSQNCTQCDNSANPPGTFASELGQNTTADGDWSFTGGYASQSSGVVSFSFGANCNSHGPYSVTLGHSIESYGLQSMVIGTGAGNEEAELLKNNISQSLMIGFGSNKSTLFVKGASGLGYTGSIGIGNITNPLAKLHIKGDNGEETMLFVEPYAFTSGESAKLRLGTMDYGVSAGYGRLFFVTGGNYIFNSTNAKVGIGTLTPTEKLEVAGNVKITTGYAMTSKVQAIDAKGLSLTGTGGTGISITNDGRVGIGTITTPSERLDVNGKVKSTALQIITGFANGKLLQSDPSGNAVWTDPAWTISGSNVYRPIGNIGIGTTPTSNRLEVSGTVNATLFSGNGSGLYNVPGDNLGNHVATQNFI